MEDNHRYEKYYMKYSKMIADLVKPLLKGDS